jgi:hypothetical protein
MSLNLLLRHMTTEQTGNRAQNSGSSPHGCCSLRWAVASRQLGPGGAQMGLAVSSPCIWEGRPRKLFSCGHGDPGGVVQIKSSLRAPHFSRPRIHKQSGKASS